MQLRVVSSYNPTRNILLIPGESSNNGNASGPVTILLRHGVTMQPSSSPLLSLSRLSTLILCTLILSTLFSTSAFAQGSSKKMLPGEGNDQDQPQKRAEWNKRGPVGPEGGGAGAPPVAAAPPSATRRRALFLSAPL